MKTNYWTSVRVQVLSFFSRRRVMRTYSGVTPRDLMRCLDFATLHHGTSPDKAGIQVILHPVRVATRMLVDGLPLAMVCAGYLHDVLKDTGATPSDMRRANIPSSVVDAVVCLTRVGDEPYEQYLDGVAMNRIAAIVKMYDMIDNSVRISPPRSEEVIARGLARAEYLMRAVRVNYPRFFIEWPSRKSIYPW